MNETLSIECCDLIAFCVIELHWRKWPWGHHTWSNDYICIYIYSNDRNAGSVFMTIVLKIRVGTTLWTEDMHIVIVCNIWSSYYKDDGLVVFKYLFNYYNQCCSMLIVLLWINPLLILMNAKKIVRSLRSGIFGRVYRLSYWKCIEKYYCVIIYSQVEWTSAFK